MAESIRSIGVKEVTYYRWRSERRLGETPEGTEGHERLAPARGFRSRTPAKAPPDDEAASTGDITAL